MGAAIAWHPTTCSPGIQGTIVQDFAKLMVASISGKGHASDLFIFSGGYVRCGPPKYQVRSTQKLKIFLT